MATYNGIWKLNDVQAVSIRNQWQPTKKLHGYGGSGSTVPGSAPYFSVVQRFSFANDTQTCISVAPLPYGHVYGSAVSDNNNGWWIGGQNESPTSPLEYTWAFSKINFSTDTASATSRGYLSLGVTFTANTCNSTDAWQTCGNSESNGYVSLIQRIIFANDTSTASYKGPNTFAIRYIVTSSDQSANGWILGGQDSTAAVVSLTSRIIFANDTALGVQKGSLTIARNLHGGSLNTFADGWVVGGNSPGGTLSTVDRIIFSTDTATATAKGPLSGAAQNVSISCSSLNNSYGYVFMGLARPSGIDRIDFSADTATALNRLNSPFQITNVAAC